MRVFVGLDITHKSIILILLTRPSINITHYTHLDITHKLTFINEGMSHRVPPMRSIGLDTTQVCNLDTTQDQS